MGLNMMMSPEITIPATASRYWLGGRPGLAAAAMEKPSPTSTRTTHTTGRNSPPLPVPIRKAGKKPTEDQNPILAKRALLASPAFEMPSGALCG